jgi:hypothetical protein
MPSHLSRRTFLAAGASAVALAACGGGGSKTTSSTSGGTASSTSAAALSLAQFFPDGVLLAGSPQRLPFGLADKDGALVKTNGTMEVTIIGPDGKALSGSGPVAGHAEGLPRPYWPVVFTPPAPGIYEIRGTINGVATAPAHVQARSTGKVPGAGQPMVPVDTATVSDRRGVQLLCTNEPVCPLHDVTLTEALAEKRPVALLLATPRFCQVAVCGPVLTVLLGVRAAFPQVRMLHTEPYPSEQAASALTPVTPLVTAYNLNYEPALFLAKSDGTIAERLDTIFDAVELTQALTRLVA